MRDALPNVFSGLTATRALFLSTSLRLPFTLVMKGQLFSKKQVLCNQKVRDREPIRHDRRLSSMAAEKVDGKRRRER